MSRSILIPVILSLVAPLGAQALELTRRDIVRLGITQHRGEGDARSYSLSVQYRNGNQIGSAALPCDSMAACRALQRELQGALNQDKIVDLNFDSNRPVATVIDRAPPNQPGAVLEPVCDDSELRVVRNRMVVMKFDLTHDILVPPNVSSFEVWNEIEEPTPETPFRIRRSCSLSLHKEAQFARTIRARSVTGLFTEVGSLEDTHPSPFITEYPGSRKSASVSLTADPTISKITCSLTISAYSVRGGEDRPGFAYDPTYDRVIEEARSPGGRGQQVNEAWRRLRERLGPIMGREFRAPLETVGIQSEIGAHPACSGSIDAEVITDLIPAEQRIATLDPRTRESDRAAKNAPEPHRSASELPAARSTAAL
jgi:hypothetical protein